MTDTDADTTDTSTTDRHVSGGLTPLAKALPARRPSVAEAARTLAEMGSTGSLATLSIDPAGYPFGSVVAYVLTDAGSPVLCISSYAEHTRNLAADPRTSLLVTEPLGPGHPMDYGRLTLLGSARPLVDVDVSLRDRYLDAHPTASAYVGYADFSFWEIEVSSLRWVGGFGRMSWVDVDSYRAASPDPTAVSALGALGHLNADHADALLAIAKAHTGHTDATTALAVRLDRYGIDLDIDTPRGEASGRAAWPEVLESADQLRMAAVALTRSARVAIGEEAASAH